MFADKAAQKLSEVFDILFKSEDTRSGRLAAPVINKLEPNTVRAGEAQPVTLKIIGDRLGKVSGVRLNADERKADTVSEKEITLKLKPEDIANVTEIKITVVTSDGATSNVSTLYASNLAITSPAATALPDANTGADYTLTITASGGSTPYKWSLSASPSWLRIDQGSGTLTGKPLASGTTKVNVSVTDKVGASISKVFDLKVS
jgi:hypothetical protein